MAVALLYLDTSALTKLVVDEWETDALRSYLAGRRAHRLVASALARTELRRAVLRLGHRHDVTRAQAQGAAQEAEALLPRVDLVRVGAFVLDRAGRQPPPLLRSLDAIHLATALALGPDLEAVIAYDQRLAAASWDAGLTVVAPAPSS